MNHFKCILDRTSQCELRRLQSSLSISNSKIQIPARIKRNSTDILHALESTLPKDSNMHIIKNFMYHDDPYLLPIKKLDYRRFALSYESGRKAAMWIHREHGDLFPKHLSNPEIKAFKPFPKYTDKNQVSEEILLNVISQCKVSDALHIYNLLDTNVSNGTKQALLELLCFYNCKEYVIKNLIFEQWFTSSKKNYVWQYENEIKELFNFLKTQDNSTAAAAYNIMICGLTKYFKVNDAWKLYEECKKKDIPFNLTTWNYVIRLFSKVFNKKKLNEEYIFEFLILMNKNKVKPNIQTLNAILKMVIELKTENVKDIIKHLLLEFKNMNIKFSLGTYYYIIKGFTSYDTSNSQDIFIQILRTLKNKTFTIQDPMDNNFFKFSMYLASQYNNKEAGNLIHELLLTGDNYKFISTVVMESDYFNSYLLLLLSTSSIKEFFEVYEKIVPNIYVPTKQLLINIINELKSCDLYILKYLPRLWSDINTYIQMDLSIKLIIIHLMKKTISSTNSSCLRTTFINAALDCWNEIKNQIIRGKTNKTIETNMITDISILLLHGDFVKESIEVLTFINKSDLCISVMTERQVNELIDLYISKQCMKGCLLIVDYLVNLGFSNQVDAIIRKLQNLPKFTNADRKKLINLVGKQVLHILNEKQLN